jgi:pSer/pThr/pTyr-binding forkhead associated (FHA) protein
VALTLVVRSSGSSGGGRELSLTVDTPRLVIGRGEGCELRLPDPSVSQRHASIRQRGGEYVLVDENSVNGTFMEAVRLPPQTPRVLRSGEQVRVGRVWLEVRIEPAVVKGSTAAAAKELALELVARGLAAAGEEPWPRLEVLEGPDQGKALVFSEAERHYVIGKSKDGDLALDDAEAARRHVELWRKGDGLWAQDLGTKTGTFLDGAPLPAAGYAFRPGQELSLGHNRLGLSYPAAEALAELERSPEEKMRPGEAPEAPRDDGSEGDEGDTGQTPDPSATPGDVASVVDKDFTPTPAPTSGALEGPRRGKKSPARPEGSWGVVDGAVVLLALGVLAASAIAAWWLFGR